MSRSAVSRRLPFAVCRLPLNFLALLILSTCFANPPSVAASEKYTVRFVEEAISFPEVDRGR